MTALFVVNDVTSLEPKQTTTMLAHGCALRDGAVWVTDVSSVYVSADGTPMCLARRAVATPALHDLPQAITSAPVDRVAWADASVAWIRTNPARDERAALHAALLDIGRLAVSAGVRVENAPRGLVAASSKLLLHQLPSDVRPQTFCTANAEELVRWAEEQAGPVVLKPLVGTRGDGVFRIVPGESNNLRQIADVLTREGHALGQPYLPGAERGDARVVLLDGEPLRVDGEVAGVRRVPPKGDFRSNVFIGGAAELLVWTEGLERVAAAAGPVLVNMGIRLAGLDIIADRVIEANVFSTGGLFDAQRFTGRDFVTPVLDALAEPARAR